MEHSPIFGRMALIFSQMYVSFTCKDAGLVTLITYYHIELSRFRKVIYSFCISTSQKLNFSDFFDSQFAFLIIRASHKS